MNNIIVKPMNRVVYNLFEFRPSSWMGGAARPATLQGASLREMREFLNGKLSEWAILCLKRCHAQSYCIGDLAQQYYMFCVRMHMTYFFFDRKKRAKAIIMLSIKYLKMFTRYFKFDEAFCGYFACNKVLSIKMIICR